MILARVSAVLQRRDGDEIKTGRGTLVSGLLAGWSMIVDIEPTRGICLLPVAPFPQS